MPVRYSKQIEKTGAALGTVVSIVRPSTYTSSTTESVEAAAWNINNDYPGWLECDGRTLNVSEYKALYSIIGNTYGGVADSTFKLPDYRSKKICGTGALNGNSGSSLGLPTSISPTGTAGGTIDTAGSSGGVYTLSSIRQLPAGSEVTPGAPSVTPLIGGNSIDTFSLGTFSSSGFSSVRESKETVLSGDVTFGVGPISNVSVSAVPPHFHFLETATAGTAKASPAPADPLGSSYNFFEDAEGTVRSFNRALRRWPGAQTGFGGVAIEGEPSTFIANGSMSLSGGAILRAFGPGTDAYNSFADYGSSVSGVYVCFYTGTSRTLTWNVDATQAENFYIFAIAGNDSNGGERVNSTGEGLRVAFNGVEQGTILPSAADSGLASGGNFSAYDAEYDQWKRRDFPISATYRTNPLTITLIQTPASSESDSGPVGIWDNIGIGKIGVVGAGSGANFDYTGGDTPIVLQRHSHMIYWDDPNPGTSVPGVTSTFGSGGGVDIDYFLESPNGLRVGSSAGTIVPTNPSIGSTITKTITVTEDIGMSMRSAIVTLSDASRVAFDNAISLRLEAAEEITLLSPYFRTKYIIKAY